MVTRMPPPASPGSPLSPFSPRGPRALDALAADRAAGTAVGHRVVVLRAVAQDEGVVVHTLPMEPIFSMPSTPTDAKALAPFSRHRDGEGGGVAQAEAAGRGVALEPAHRPASG